MHACLYMHAPCMHQVMQELREATKVPPGGGQTGAPAANPTMAQERVMQLEKISETMLPTSRTLFFGTAGKLFSKAPDESVHWFEMAMGDARKFMAPAQATYTLQNYAFTLFFAHYILRVGKPAEGRGELYLAGMPKEGSSGYPSEMRCIFNWLKYPDYAPTDLPCLAALQSR